MQTTGRRARSDILESTWIYISVPLYDGMVCWPGDSPVRIERVTDVERGDSHTLSQLTMGSHSGTHIDAPVHFLKGRPGIDAVPLGRYELVCLPLKITGGDGAPARAAVRLIK